MRYACFGFVYDESSDDFGGGLFSIRFLGGWWGVESTSEGTQKVRKERACQRVDLQVRLARQKCIPRTCGAVSIGSIPLCEIEMPRLVLLRT